MAIKVIATDMDGTFLNSSNDYDRPKFTQLFQKMQEQDIKFVVISGNQYYQIKSFFPGLEDQITFVGENGAYLVENNRFLKSHRLSDRVVRTVLDYLAEQDLLAELTLCGEASAYVLKQAKKEVKDFFAIYYHRLLEVDDFQQLPQDHFLKFSFNTPIDQTLAIVDALNDRLGDEVQAVTSGHGNIDVIAKGIHKGSAMAYLLDHWQLSSDQLLAFGDGGNDLEMLDLAKYSYAMANGSEDVKARAKYEALSNDQSGVLTIIEEFLN